MSEIQPLSGFGPMGEALPAMRPWGSLPAASHGFLRDPRFARALPPPPQASFTPMPEPDLEDPLEQARAQGYAQGAAEARREAEALAAAQDAARHRLEAAFRAIDAHELDALETRLRETVEALCASVLADAALDPAGLAARVRRAAQMLARADDQRVIRLHPEDFALLGHHLPAGWPEDWHYEPDPALERGTVRVDGAMGGVEDGPAQWRKALDEALQQV